MRKGLILILSLLLLISMCGCSKDKTNFDDYTAYLGQDADQLPSGLEKSDEGDIQIFSSRQKVSFDTVEGYLEYRADKDGKVVSLMWSASHGEDPDFDVYRQSEKLLQRLADEYGDYDSFEGELTDKGVYSWEDADGYQIELTVYGENDMSYYVATWAKKD